MPSISKSVSGSMTTIKITAEALGGNTKRATAATQRTSRPMRGGSLSGGGVSGVSDLIGWFAERSSSTDALAQTFILTKLIDGDLIAKLPLDVVLTRDAETPDDSTSQT
jgi:hypothetical protein